MIDTRDTVLREAQRAFHHYDKARNELREAEAAIDSLRRRYNMVEGCRGIRAEGLRIATENRFGKRAA